MQKYSVRLIAFEFHLFGVVYNQDIPSAWGPHFHQDQLMIKSCVVIRRTKNDARKMIHDVLGSSPGSCFSLVNDDGMALTIGRF